MTRVTQINKPHIRSFDYENLPHGMMPLHNNFD